MLEQLESSNKKNVYNEVSFKDIIFDKKNSEITLTGFKGHLGVSSEDILNDYSSVVLTIYEDHDDNYTGIENVLYRAKIIIKGGKLYFTGAFSSDDVDFSSDVSRSDFSKNKAFNTKATFKNGDKKIKLPKNIDLSNIIVELSGDAGNLNLGIPEKFNVETNTSVSSLRSENATALNNYPIEFTMSPSPASSNFNVQITLQNSQNIKLYIFDFFGNVIKELYVGDIKENEPLNIETDVSDIKNGSYILRLVEADNSWARPFLISK